MTVSCYRARRLLVAEQFRGRFLDPFSGAAEVARVINDTLNMLPTYEAVAEVALATTGSSLYALDHGLLVCPSQSFTFSNVSVQLLCGTLYWNTTNTLCFLHIVCSRAYAYA